MQLSSSSRVLIVISTVGLLAGCGSQQSRSPASTAVSLVEASRPSPFARCSTPGPDQNYLNDKVEPSLAVHDATATSSRTQLIGAWQQDRWPSGGSRGIVAGWSSDGGRTWHDQHLPFSVCAHGLTYDRADDPSVSVGSDGTAYVTAMALGSGSVRDTAIVTAASSDGGRRWKNIRTVIVDRHTGQFLNDKDTVTADPTRPDTAYVVWDRGDNLTNTQPLMFSRTLNAGRTWSKARVILPTGGGVDGGEVQGASCSQIVVNPRTKTLYNVIMMKLERGPLVRWDVASMTSTDGGTTWSQPHSIFKTLDILVRTKVPLRTGWCPIPAVDPKRGSLDIVWPEPSFSHDRYNEVAFSRSLDGTHWTAPVRLNLDTGQTAFTPQIAVTPSGVIGVTYYQVRHARLGSHRWMTDYWIRISRDGGKTFGRPQHIAGPFDATNAPTVEGGYFLGDYEGLAAEKNAFAVLFVEPNTAGLNNAGTNNPTNVFATTVPVS